MGASGWDRGAPARVTLRCSRSLLRHGAARSTTVRSGRTTHPPEQPPSRLSPLRDTTRAREENAGCCAREEARTTQVVAGRVDRHETGSRTPPSRSSARRTARDRAQCESLALGQRPFVRVPGRMSASSAGTREKAGAEGLQAARDQHASTDAVASGRGRERARRIGQAQAEDLRGIEHQLRAAEDQWGWTAPSVSQWMARVSSQRGHEAVSERCRCRMTQNVRLSPYRSTGRSTRS